MKYLLWTSVVTLAGCLTDVEAQEDLTNDASVSVPPIDAVAPPHVETASFALG